MTPVEQWRAIEKLVSQRWTEEAISNALLLPIRILRKLRLLARLHPPILDRMHAGDMPRESDLRTIAYATLEEQAAAWKKHKPKKTEAVNWWQLAGALARKRMRAADAQFDAEFAAAYGVEYAEDLFAQPDEDSRTTTNVEGFLAAQHAWVEAHLPKNGVILQAEPYGGLKLPPKAQRFYGKPGTGGEQVGYCVNERTGQVDTVLFTLPTAAKATKGKTKTGAGGDTPAVPAKARPELTQKGEAMVGDMRTDALHAALRDEPIDDTRLIALLVLAFAGTNVEVKTGLADRVPGGGSRAAIAGLLTEGGAVTSDPAIVNTAARAMLSHALSCRQNWSDSGAVARLAGDVIGADSHLPNMATADFLACLSKAAVEDVAIGLGVPVQPTRKATRGAVIARVGEGRWIYPPAVFSGAGDALAEQVEAERRRTSWMTRPSDAEADTKDGDDLSPDEEGLGSEPADADDAMPELDDAPAVEAEPDIDVEPAKPSRRRRSRKDDGAVHAAP